MATFFSDTNVGTWAGYTMTGTLTGTVTRSGNTVTLSGMSIALRVPAGQAWGDDNWSFTVNGTQTGFHVYAAGDGYSLGSYSLNSTSKTVGASDTSTSIGWSSGDGVTGSFTVTFPSGYTAPTGLAISPSAIGTDSVTFSVSITSYGDPSSSAGRYIQASLFDPNSTYFSGNGRYTNATETLSADITVDNNSSAGGGTPPTISPNTTYRYYGYADNTQAHSVTSAATLTTKAAAAAISLDSVTDTTATIAYLTSADGGAHTKTLEYSLDGTTWATGATISTGSASSGTFTITNLTASTTYNVQTRVTTTSGSTTGPTVTVTTSAPATTAAFYGSVSGLSKKVKKMYGPVSATAYEATALTNNIGFDATTFMSKWESTKGLMKYPPKTLQINRSSGGTASVRVSLDKGGGVIDTYVIFTYTDGAYNDEGVVWGFASEPQNGVFTSTSTTKTVTKKITKLYASKNGVTKLVYEA